MRLSNKCKNPLVHEPVARESKGCGTEFLLKQCSSHKTHGTERRVSLLIELEDRPGALETVLRPFARHGVNLTHIESRPRGRQTFDFYVDCEGERGEAAVDATIEELTRTAVHVIVLDDTEVPWFPRHIAELDQIAGNTQNAGGQLQADHPGFSDLVYRRRRASIEASGKAFRHGEQLPVVNYTARGDRDLARRLSPTRCAPTRLRLP